MKSVLAQEVCHGYLCRRYPNLYAFNKCNQYKLMQPKKNEIILNQQLTMNILHEY